ncbi:MAG: TonB-dependent receptor [Acidobacteriaceae bacterium]|nr:TonB-dependent receptor [Acidobacteriaceae bacterium]MBV9502547.1 TonB-dependent receptor [Acidobacteriaceae bacterium]
MRLYKLVLAICALAGSARLSLSQVDRASVTGTVTDQSGAVVSNAEVEATSTKNGEVRTVTTNSAGVYTIPNLSLGMYTVTVDKRGFTQLKFDSVECRVGAVVTLNARLRVATVQTATEVVATEPPLNESSAAVSGVIDSTQIQNLPMNGRNWASLLVLAPLAIDDGGGDQRSIRFAGHGRDDNNYMIDGVDATGIQEQAQKSTTRLQVSEDAIEEYRVSTALYDAQYGAGNGGQIDIVTKSGTNEFHGGAFEYLRNSVFDSRSFLDLDLDPAAPAKTNVPPFRLNQFGGTIGGPIKKDKTFFFLSYEGFRQFRGQTLHAFVPSASFKQQVLQTSPALAPILSAYPTGQLPVDDQTAEFTHLGTINLHEDSGLARIDHRFTDNTSLYFRMSIDDSFATAPLGNLLDQQQIINRPQNYVLSLSHVFSPTVFNEIKFGVNRSPFHNPQVSVFPLAVNLANFEPLNNNNTDNEVGTTWGYIDDATVVLGRHTLKFGAEVRRIWLNQGITDDNSITFADNNGILNDQLDSLSLKSSWWSHGLRHTFVLPYFEDQFKLRPNLTINAGLRWEYYSPVTEVNDRTRVFDFYRCQGICPAGSALEFANYTNFDPRLGIAYGLNDKTVIRTGFGIYHGPGQNDDRNAALESDNVRLSLTSADVPDLSYPITPFITTAETIGVTPRALQRDRKDLYTMNYGFSIERNLPADFVLSTGYTGIQGRRLFARTYINTIDPTTGQRPLLGFGQIDIKQNDGNSTFNGLNVSLNRHFTSGFSFTLQYLYSHSENDGSVGGGEANAPQNVACRKCDWGPSVFDVRHSIVASGVYALPFGKGKQFATTGFASALLSGWILSGMNLWHTGHPLDVTLDTPANFVPDGNNSNTRPDVVPGVSVVPAGQGVNNWVNPAAFMAPPTDANGNLLRFGDAGRGLVRASLTWQTDISLSRTFKLTERLALEFIAQAFNIFNHDQYADPNNLSLTYNPPDATHAQGYVTVPAGFGQITSIVNFNSNSDKFVVDNTGTGLPRELQFAVRVTF